MVAKGAGFDALARRRAEGRGLPTCTMGTLRRPHFVASVLYHCIIRHGKHSWRLSGKQSKGTIFFVICVYKRASYLGAPEMSLFHTSEQSNADVKKLDRLSQTIFSRSCVACGAGSNMAI